MRAYVSPLGRLRMLAGDPALDFANTRHVRHGQEVDFLADYACLLGFAGPAGLLDDAESAALSQAAAADPAAAGAVWAQAVGLRDLWRNHLAEAVEGRAGEAGSRLDARLEALLREGLHASGPPALRLPLVRAALAIASLRLIPAGRRIGRCAGDPCGGFFLDSSRSKPRRWCSMDSCGNRAKVRDHRSRFAAEAVDGRPQTRT